MQSHPIFQRRTSPGPPDMASLFSPSLVPLCPFSYLSASAPATLRPPPGHLTPLAPVAT